MDLCLQRVYAGQILGYTLLHVLIGSDAQLGSQRVEASAGSTRGAFHRSIRMCMYVRMHACE